MESKNQYYEDNINNMEKKFQCSKFRIHNWEMLLILWRRLLCDSRTYFSEKKSWPWLNANKWRYKFQVFVAICNNKIPSKSKIGLHMLPFECCMCKSTEGFTYFNKFIPHCTREYLFRFLNRRIILSVSTTQIDLRKIA